MSQKLSDMMLVLSEPLKDDESIIIRSKEGSFYAHLGRPLNGGKVIFLIGYENYPPECVFLAESSVTYQERKLEAQLSTRGALQQ